VARVLVISAHPDDETMAAGGTIAMYAEQGDDVYVLEATRGEGGEVGDPPLTDLAHLGEYREGELRQALAILGVRDVFFLPYVDPHMEIDGEAQRIDVPMEEFVAAITGYLRQIQPDVVLTHGTNGEYGHPQHIYTFQAARLALAAYGKPVTLLTWGAWYPNAEQPEMLNHDDRADVIRNISPWLEKKIAAAMCHRTQHAMFLRNTSAPSVEAMVPKIESFRQIAVGG
jgi:LmbE family N-acetylglucosaminyl deacetylase